MITVRSEASPSADTLRAAAQNNTKYWEPYQVLLNRITYNLNILASVFLPLGFVTGLFGMSVAGIPDAHNPWAFAIICVVMVLIAIVSWLFLRWRRWI